MIVQGIEVLYVVIFFCVELIKNCQKSRQVISENIDLNELSVL